MTTTFKPPSIAELPSPAQISPPALHDSPETLLKLRRLSMICEVFYFNTRGQQCPTDLLMASTFHIPEAADDLLRSVGYELHHSGHFPSGLSFCFLTNAACLLIKKVSMDAYTFWHLVRIASERTTRLPLRFCDIKHAIREASSELGLERNKESRD